MINLTSEFPFILFLTMDWIFVVGDWLPKGAQSVFEDKTLGVCLFWWLARLQSVGSSFPLLQIQSGRLCRVGRVDNNSSVFAVRDLIITYFVWSTKIDTILVDTVALYFLSSVISYLCHSILWGAVLPRRVVDLHVLVIITLPILSSIIVLSVFVSWVLKTLSQCGVISHLAPITHTHD